MPLDSEGGPNALRKKASSFKKAPMGVYADGGLENVFFFQNYWGFVLKNGKMFGLFLDSSWFSASVPQIFTPKDALGPDFGPEQNFGKSRFLDPHRRGPPSAPF